MAERTARDCIQSAWGAANAMEVATPFEKLALAEAAAVRVLDAMTLMQDDMDDLLVRVEKLEKERVERDNIP